MNKPLLLSLAAATLLGTNLNAESMYDRIQAMELEMNKMKQELTTLKAEKADSEDEEESEITATDDEESQEEDEEKETYFEIRIQVDALTKDVSLMITDFAEEDEIEDTKMFWENQIAELKHVIGA